MAQLSDKQRGHLAAVANGGVTGLQFRLEWTFTDANAEGQEVWLDGRTIRSLEKRGLIRLALTRPDRTDRLTAALTDAGRKELS